MSHDSETLNLIQSSFPGQEGLIEHAFNGSRSFRELCEDYYRCVAALRRWECQSAAEAPQHHREYTELLAELGREVETWLEGESTGSELSDRSSE